MTDDKVDDFLKSKTDEELREMILQAKKAFVIQLAIFIECEKRLHEMKFHGRDGSITELQETIQRAWKGVTDFILQSRV